MEPFMLPVSTPFSAKFWSREEDKLLEMAIIYIPEYVPNRWDQIAALFPGKTALDVITRYMDLEQDMMYINLGLIPYPNYVEDWHSVSPPPPPPAKPQESRTKGYAWTEEEHKQFLRGLKKYGKGEWKSIAREFVKTRTSQQVASHAQKYWKRKNDPAATRKRHSIHDVTL